MRGYPTRTLGPSYKKNIIILIEDSEQALLHSRSLANKEIIKIRE